MTPSKNDIIIIQQLLQQLGIEPSKEDAAEQITLNYLNNPDGSIRWAWPSNSRKANFLHFYSTGSWRAKLFAKVLYLLSILNLSILFRSGKLSIHLSELAKETLHQVLGTDFALFTGTVGPNRKGLIWCHHNSGPCFIKIPLNELSASIIHNEKESLHYVEQLNLSKSSSPKILGYENNCLIINDVRTSNQSRATNISEIHLEAIAEIVRKTTSQGIIHSSEFWKKTIQRVSDLATSSDKRLPVNLIRKLEWVVKTVNTNTVHAQSLYHGDFTPWNMYVSENSIQVYDWELSERNQPALWDAFHFVCQSGILVHKSDTLDIYDRIQNVITSPTLQKLINDHGIDADLHFKLYLLFNISYYLKVYEQQEHWHVQVQWLLQTWNELLSILIEKEKGFSQRQLFCMDLFDRLQPLSYAALKFLSRNAESIPVQSDIDLCIQKSDISLVAKTIRNHPFTGSLTVQRKSFMNNYMVVMKDSGLLSIDCIWQFKRKQIEMLDAAALRESAILHNNGIKTPSPEMDFSYTWLFYLLNGAALPEKYRQQVSQLRSAEQEIVLQYVKRVYQIQCTALEQLFDYHSTTKLIVMNSISRHSSNSGLQKWINQFNYYKDSISSSLFKKGMIITFSGVDGAGKSTVIENIRTQIEKGLRKKVIVRRHRPSILPILSAWKYGKEAAEQRSASTLPRQGKNKSRLSSLFRFAYYYTDYFIGQFYILFRYVWRGYVVIYDRYYFDFINDSKRSNINLPAGFTTGLYRFLVKPDLNFFLYASPEDILQRKKELDAETIKILTEQYLSLFEGLSTRYQQSKYIPIHNKELDQTLSTIYELVKTRA